jgi:hypothetical protein
MPVKSPALARVFDDGAILQEHYFLGLQQLPRETNDHRVPDDLTEPLVLFPQIEEKGNRVREARRRSTLLDGREPIPSVGLPTARILWIEQLKCVGACTSREVFLHCLTELRYGFIVKHSDREEEPILVELVNFGLVKRFCAACSVATLGLVCHDVSSPSLKYPSLRVSEENRPSLKLFRPSWI